MELASWLKRSLYKKINFPGGAGGECVDLVNDYISSVWGVDPVRANAEDWDKARIPGALYTPNTRTNYPRPGSVVVWHGPLASIAIGTNGHVAVALVADADYLYSADQNWGANKYAGVVEHDYRGVHGWWSRNP